MTTSTPTNSGRGLRRGSIVDALLEDIFGGVLRGGEHLVTQALAERFGVSHTPVREALIALGGIGVVDLLPNRGAVVRRVTPEDVRAISRVRRVLECEAVRGACGRMDRATLETLRAELGVLAASIPTAELAEVARTLDTRLHDGIAAACGNALLASELGRLKSLFRGLRDAAWRQVEARNDYRRMGEEAAEHLAIVEALLAGQRKAAASAMADHVLSSIRCWNRALPLAGGSPSRRETPAHQDIVEGGAR